MSKTPKALHPLQIPSVQRKGNSQIFHPIQQSSNLLLISTDLGASPNYRDTRGLTPLYYSVTHNTDPLLCEALLHDYAVIGASDSQGWQETHQVRQCALGDLLRPVFTQTQIRCLQSLTQAVFCCLRCLI